jgi:hypothetical protein
MSLRSLWDTTLRVTRYGELRGKWVVAGFGTSMTVYLSPLNRRLNSTFTIAPVLVQDVILRTGWECARSL